MEWFNGKEGRASEVELLESGLLFGFALTTKIGSLAFRWDTARGRSQFGPRRAADSNKKSDQS
jgi:hypothetical protein